MKIRLLKDYPAALLLLIALAFFLGSNHVRAADVGAILAEEYLKKNALTDIDTQMTLDQAAKVQEEFVNIISREYGAPVGYKAGLTNPNVQKVFGVSQPVRGTLLEKMLIKSGATVPAGFGAISFAEGDLVVRVGDEAVNQVKSAEETLKYLDAVIPFIELPDMAFDKTVKPTAAAIVAINVGTRHGVMGDPIPLAATPEWRDRLKNFTLQAFDEKGALLGEAKGTALLGDPLSVVLWLKDSLAAEGKKLKKGDLLSLGSLTKPIPAKPGTGVKVRYIGLDPKGPVEISVSFK
ncbi:MAG: 2-hydroxyhexa-2,4-dienoate hydratase [Syntrophorhabdaceae bacterium PtaU1.Bin034]|jgi:2-keto-4-pentenoate hydratase|nr:MAG: 2-hydroxyhexa-2,4-dienoate hydratase [Syntrophorhabdaceae bacterium PtaU1.Bin034]